MLIARNTVVTLKYSVRDSDGDAVDEGSNPLVYLHGGPGGGAGGGGRRAAARPSLEACATVHTVPCLCAVS